MRLCKWLVQTSWLGALVVGRHMFSKTLICLSADGWGCIPSLLVVWPEGTQHWSLQAVRWGQWWSSGGLIPIGSSQNCCWQVPLSSWWATAIPHLCRRCSNASRCVWFSLLWGHCSFPLGPGAHKILCVPSRSGVSVSPSPVEILQSNPAGLQSQILWGFPVLLPDHQSGKPDLGLRNFTPVGEHLSFNHYPVWGSPTQQVWDLILSWLFPSYHLLVASCLSLDVGYLFW